MKSVNNPLTIIALFAALAEIAGTVAIKLVAPDMQPTFIWFVMIFPTLIVVLFFITLNFNAKVLYAPGDFKNEENYLAIQNAKQGLAIENVETMIAEARTKIISEVMKTVSTNGTGDKSKVEEIVNDKLSPIQVAIESVKSFRLYPFSTPASLGFDGFRRTATDIWMIIHRAANPLTLEEIALQSQTDIPLTIEALASLITWDKIKKITDENGNIRFTVSDSTIKMQ
jgi:hypothetical protein